MKTAKQKRHQKRQAFVFTLDAMLVLPLVILIISSLIAFSSTLKENVLLHEYTYIIAKDSVNYLAELEIGAVSIQGLTLSENETHLSVLGYVTKHLTDTPTTRLAINGSLNSTIPSFAAYVFEYRNNTNWVEIARGGNTAKFAPGNYSFQVSVIKLVSGLSEPAPGNPCAADIVCKLPIQTYSKGEIIGPVMFRIRVYA